MKLYRNALNIKHVHAFTLLFINYMLFVQANTYSDIYDEVNIDAILKNERLVTQYISCLLEKGPCTAEGRSLKIVLPEALATNCEKCNDRQKQIARQIATYLKEKKPDTWGLFKEKYDPREEYAETFEELFIKH